MPTSAAALVALAGVGVDVDDQPGADALRDVADTCLDGFAEVGRLEARAAAVKVRLAAEYARGNLRPLVAPRSLRRKSYRPGDGGGGRGRVRPDGQRTVCLRTVSPRAAVLTTALPLTLEALQAGTISWQHARIMVDETTNLDRPGWQHWRRISWTRTSRSRPGGVRSGELVPGRCPGQGADVAGTPPPGEHRETPSEVCGGPEGRVRPGPRRHGLAQLLPPGATPPRGSGNGPPPGPGRCRARRVPDSDPAPRRRRGRPASEQRSRRQRDSNPGRRDRNPAGAGVAGAVDGAIAGGVASLGMCGGVPVPRAQVLVTVPVMSLPGPHG